VLPLDPDTFRQIVETPPVGVYVVGLDRKISYWNKAAEQITGYLSQEVMGRPCHADLLLHCGARGTPVLCKRWMPADVLAARWQAD
jgi:PAS domain-containing protein